MKDCKLCGETKALEDFAPHKNYKDDYSNCCRECTKHKARVSNLKKRYGITPEEYDAAMESSVVCEICGEGGKLVYDHNHDTGDFRGVLCSRCNAGLGQFYDSPAKLTQALQYLLERGYYGRT